MRIEVPPTAKPAPQATVKIQPTPSPVRQTEAPVSRAPAIVPAAAPRTTEVEAEEVEYATANDPSVMYASYAVLAIAAVSFVFQLLTFLAP